MRIITVPLPERSKPPTTIVASRLRRRLALADHSALDQMEGSKQRRGPVRAIVVGVGAAASGLERQSGLRAIEGLDLALLVDAKHHGGGRSTNSSYRFRQPGK
jgi:hypothetical protein